MNQLDVVVTDDVAVMGDGVHLFDGDLNRALMEGFNDVLASGHCSLKDYLKWVKEETGTTVSQEEYFQTELKHLSQTKDNLRIWGWDNELMSRMAYLQKLAELTRRQKPVAIKMIIPEDVYLIGLEGAADIARVQERPQQGYVIFDNWCISYWDTTRRSAYSPEAKSVIYRAHDSYIPKRDISELVAQFDRQFAAAKGHNQSPG